MPKKQEKLIAKARRVLLGTRKKRALSAVGNPKAVGGSDVEKERFLATRTIQELEAIYRDPMVKAGVHARATLITKKGFNTVITDLKGEENTATKDLKVAINDFFRENEADKRVEPLNKARDVYGKAAWELKYDDPEVRTKLKGLGTIIDIANFDYIRDEQKRIRVDPDTREIIGYIEKDLSEPLSSVKFDPEQIAFFHRNPFGGREPFPFIESIYSVTEAKQNIEFGIGNAVYRLGMPIVEGTVGTDEMPADDADIKDEAEKLSELVAGQDVYVHDHTVQFKVHHPPSLKDMNSGNDYMINQISTGLMMPKIYLMGVADTHATTLSSEAKQYLIDILQGDQRSIGRIIENSVMKIFYEKNYPKVNLKNIKYSLEWPEISEEDLDALASRHKIYGELGVMTPDEMRKELGMEPLTDEQKVATQPRRVSTATEFSFE